MLHFQHKEYLLLVLIPGLMVFLFVRLLKWKKRTASRIGDPDLIQDLIGDFSDSRFRYKFYLFALAVLSIIFALATLVLPEASRRIHRKGTDIVVALDVSKSMLATDIKPNRLERAKQLIYKVIESSPDDRIGIVIFAGRAYLQMPLTLDHAAAKMYVSAITPNDIPTQGTVLHYALQMSGAAFNPNEKTYKSVLLISDGEDHDANAVKEAKNLFKQGIVVNTVGIGSVEGAPVPDEEGGYKTDKGGKTVISKLNEAELMSIAEAAQGTYLPFTVPGTMAQKLRDQLDNIDQISMVSDATYASFKQFFQLFVAAALFFLLLETFISERRRKLSGAVILAFLCFMQSSAFAQNKEKLREGNRAYIENRFAEAERAYKGMVDQNGQDAVAGYNLGNALFKQDKTEEAVRAYDHAIAATKDNALKQKAFYNQGVALHKAGDLQKAIVSYKNSLLLDPNDEEARQNLQKALQQQQQQQQGQENKKQQQQSDRDEKKKNDRNQKEEQKKSQPNISKQEAEEKLRALLEKEKQLQEKLKKVTGVETNQPEKDW